MNAPEAKALAVGERGELPIMCPGRDHVYIPSPMDPFVCGWCSRSLEEARRMAAVSQTKEGQENGKD